jgi:TrmH family RNA methyltransferase
MKVLKITKENTQFQIINALKTNREKRNHQGFLFEGVRNINNAVKYGWKIKAFFYSLQKGLSVWAKDILKLSQVEIQYNLSLELLNKLSNKEEASELLALAEIPKDDLAKIPIKDDLLVVVFDRPSSPGNLGTIIRTCDALGADGLIITGHSVDVYDPETISATTGSLFSLPIVRLPSQKKLEPWIQEVKEKYPDFRVVGTDEDGDQTIYEYEFKKPVVLLAGNEKWGLSAGYKEMADDMVKIPMQGSASSLNVAVATSIIVSEIKRQRNALRWL